MDQKLYDIGLRRANDVTRARLDSGQPADYAVASGGRTTWPPVRHLDSMMTSSQEIH